MRDQASPYHGPGNVSIAKPLLDSGVFRSLVVLFAKRGSEEDAEPLRFAQVMFVIIFCYATAHGGSGLATGLDLEVLEPAASMCHNPAAALIASSLGASSCVLDRSMPVPPTAVCTCVAPACLVVPAALQLEWPVTCGGPPLWGQTFPSITGMITALTSRPVPARQADAAALRGSLR